MTAQDKALIITFSGAGLLVLFFFFVTIHPFDDTQVAQEEFIPIPVLEELPEPEEELTEEELAQQEQLSHQLSSHDRLQREAERFFSEQDEIRDALQQETEANENDEDLSENEPGVDYNEKIALLRQRSREPKSTDNEKEKEQAKVNTSTSRRTTISYVLKDRNAMRIPNPVYTCDATGKVVINIEVNGSGLVTKTAYNKRASTTSNGCLIDQAIEYASRAYFNNASKAKQLGSITFEFQG